MTCSCSDEGFPVQAAAQSCVLVTHAEEAGQYNVTVCDAIGTPTQAASTDVEPNHVAMTSTHVVAAAGTKLFVWHYHARQGQSLKHLL